MATHLPNMRVLDTCDSTHVWASQRVNNRERCVLVRARTQHAGMGRSGRVWRDDGGHGGSLLMTLALAPQHSRIGSFTGVEPVAPAMLEGLSVRAAQRVADALHAFGTARLYVKEPNDLVDAAGAKAAGLLVDTLIVDQDVQRIVLSIGLNVTWSPVDIGRTTVSLGDLGPTPGADQLAPVVAQALWESVYSPEHRHTLP